MKLDIKSLISYVTKPTTIMALLFLLAGCSADLQQTHRQLAQFAYTANYGSSHISAYAVASSTGASTALAGAPFPTAPGPTFATVSFRAWYVCPVSED
jgi:hypothetical protein